jgi:hypothetical protein
MLIADVKEHEKMCEYRESISKDQSSAKELAGGPTSTTEGLSLSTSDLAREWRVSEVTHQVKPDVVCAESSNEEVEKLLDGFNVADVAMAMDQCKTLFRELARFLFVCV